MFKGTLLFKLVECPELKDCPLPNCTFSHVSTSNTSSLPAENPMVPVDQHTETDLLEQRYKRRRLNDAKSDRNSGQSTNSHRIPPKKDFERTPAESGHACVSASGPKANVDRQPSKFDDKTMQNSSQRDPLPAKRAVSLNPSMIPNPPATHAIRTQLAKMLYEQYNRLNNDLKASNAAEDRDLLLSTDEVIRLAMDEEHKLAVESHQIYSNVIKLRILKLKKMRIGDWKDERRTFLARKAVTTAKASDYCESQTGLSMSQELAFLQRLLADQEPLEKHGYVIRKPRPSEIEETRKGLDAAHGWEQCDRCRTRFQVFPERRVEDGALTSGGSCTHHPGRSRRPLPTDKADKIMKEPVFTCCQETLGASGGCTIAPTHVFKASHVARLEVVEPFVETPERSLTSAEPGAVCFDCEMGYTTLGLELIRLTAVSWSDGKEIVDVLVRPKGHILDLNSRYSGVWPSDFADAVAYNQDNESGGNSSSLNAVDKGELRIVDSPGAARRMLFSRMNPSTPLIGHALENDLNAARIIHPSIIDTVLLYPHPKGLPVRFGLKALMKKHLDRDIQIGDGGVGHDSKEDARAAGDLVRLKVQQGWKKMQREGWRVHGDTFLPPMTRAEAMKADIANARRSLA